MAKRGSTTEITCPSFIPTQTQHFQLEKQSFHSICSLNSIQFQGSLTCHICATRDLLDHLKLPPGDDSLPTHRGLLLCSDSGTGLGSVKSLSVPSVLPAPGKDQKHRNHLRLPPSCSLGLIRRVSNPLLWCVWSSIHAVQLRSLQPMQAAGPPGPTHHSPTVFCSCPLMTNSLWNGQ